MQQQIDEKDVFEAASVIQELRLLVVGYQNAHSPLTKKALDLVNRLTGAGPLAPVAGFEVQPIDKPVGHFQWFHFDSATESDEVFSSWKEAWAAAEKAVIEETIAEMNLSDEQWEALSADEQAARVREVYVL